MSDHEQDTNILFWEERSSDIRKSLMVNLLRFTSFAFVGVGQTFTIHNRSFRLKAFDKEFNGAFIIMCLAIYFLII